MQEIYKVLRVSRSLKGWAKIPAAMTLHLLQMNQAFAIVIMSVLQATLEYGTLILSIKFLLEERIELYQVDTMLFKDLLEAKAEAYEDCEKGDFSRNS